MRHVAEGPHQSATYRARPGSAGLVKQPRTGTTVHTLRHTFATTLVRGGTDLVIVAELWPYP
jgi:integrase